MRCVGIDTAATAFAVILVDVMSVGDFETTYLAVEVYVVHSNYN